MFSTLHSFCLIIFGLNCLLVQGFKQEIFMYLKDADRYLYFEDHQPDLSRYSEYLEQVDRICLRGMWCTFTEVNFLSFSQIFGTPNSPHFECLEGSALKLDTKIKSLRHLGSNDTTVEAISLYVANDDFAGPEILITGQALLNLQKTIFSLVVTGRSLWTIFEGPFLDGYSLCVGLTGDEIFHGEFIYRLNMISIGSVFRGCDEQEIQDYREKYTNSQNVYPKENFL